MTIIQIDAHVARYMATALLPAASRDDVTPVLTGAHISIEDGNLRAVSTDRYRVHAVLINILGEAPGAVDAIIPRAALAWLSKNAGTYSRSRGAFTPAVIIEIDEQRVTLRVREDKDLTDADEVTFATSLIKGTFPPVMRLIEAARDKPAIVAEGVMTPDFLASIKALDWDGNRARIKFTEGSGTKAGPAYINVSDRAEALIQPQVEMKA